MNDYEGKLNSSWAWRADDLRIPEKRESRFDRYYFTIII